MNRPASALVITLAASVLLAASPRMAMSAPVATDAVARSEGLLEATDARTLLANTLARGDVADALRAQGVDAEAVQARVDALTDSEAQLLAARITDAPAGSGDVLGTVVFIFVLLLVTDILGFTKVYPFTRAIR